MSQLPLFEHYPLLLKNLPHVSLAQLPTPVARVEHPLTGHDVEIYIKRDDLSAAVYGGNKVRKLEFLLGRALSGGAKAVMTFGAAGSNHALATAIYARQTGLKSISMLLPQPNAQSIRRNLLMGFHVGAELHHYETQPQLNLGVVYQMQRHLIRDGRLPHVIPPGGSSPIGTVGFVNAALELKRQVEEGVLPEPDCLYAASGTMGTVIGLLLGLAASGLRTRVVAVRVTPPPYTTAEKARALYEMANGLLHDADSQFPIIPFPENRFELRDEFFSPGYGVFTETIVEAIRRAKSSAGIKIEGTYTGKAFAALLADAESGALRGKTALFWHTYNSHDFTKEIAQVDYRALPKEFHRYFEEEVQALDPSERI
ncbi:MAG TPA: pyridoxal-phosphate dependent enzyme [Candidatus Hydrogenedentes bacterium]|nr:pyridoxal-phosphate dependent enzyme [Candidatus Hydrogenedentota bacterium]